MTEDDFPTSLEETRERLIASRAAFASHWQGLTPAQMTHVPGPTPLWSVKDLIAHIIWWENYTLTQMVLVAGGAPPASPSDWDTLNERVRRSAESMTLDDVLADFANNEKRLLAALDGFTFEEIDMDLKYRGNPIGALLAADTWGHYEEHEPDLAQYLAKLNAA
jgi:DNA segregation ATPase FtsK/SpoIIIE-like protein